MSNENLKIWDSVRLVEQKYTKQANVDGNNQTTISTLYPIRQMTAAYGPIGGRWHFDIIEERFDETKPMIKDGEPVIVDGKALWELVHTVRMALFIDGKKASEQFGHTRYRYMTQKGFIQVDLEAPKKSVSDAQKKCLSYVGVCADVYMGDFDDQNYRAESQDIIAFNKVDKSTEEESEQIEKIKAEYEDGMKAMGLATNARAVTLLYDQKMKFFAPRLKSQNETYKNTAGSCVKHLTKERDRLIKEMESKK